MNRIDIKFKELREKQELAFIPYITAGDFGLETTRQLIKTIAESGGDLIEIGIPYSDPVADGPVIEKASARALKLGVKTDQIFNMVANVRKEISIPLLFMMYYNSVLRYDPEKFARRCSDVGIDGIIVPDLPFEEAGEIKEVFESRGIYLIHFIAPTSEKRIQKIVKSAKGFLYCVSSTGVTGERKNFSKDLYAMLSKVKEISSIPRAVGFGISLPEHIRNLKGHCEAAIAGTVVIKTIEKFAGTPKLLLEIKKLVENMKIAGTI